MVESRELKEQEELIQNVIRSFSHEDILSASRNIGIDPKDFYVSNISISKLANDFVERVYQEEKEKQLKEYIDNQRSKINTRINISDKSAEKFFRLLNTFLDKLDEVDEKPFNESELFDPIEFEEKMRKKAKLSEDIVVQGIILKPSICVLRRKANAFGYDSYRRLIQKLAKFYNYNICAEYPRDKYPADERFTYLRNALIEMIPEDLFDRDEDRDDDIDCIIFETISKCLIFND